jgi:hypothetical protein
MDLQCNDVVTINVSREKEPAVIGARNNYTDETYLCRGRAPH